MSISERKLAGTNQIISEEPNVDKLPEESPTGYRFMDMNILSNVFDAVARCPDCGNKLKLLQTKKQGISFEMMLSCLNTECQWVGAKRIFCRSIDKNKLRYMEYYGDGDTKSFSVVGNVYPETKVLKKECIGHIQRVLAINYVRKRKLKKVLEN